MEVLQEARSVELRFVGLGAACQTAYQIRRHTANDRALFFDWLVSMDLTSIDLILNHFDEAAFLTGDCTIVDKGLRVFDPWSRLKFQHDFPSHGALIDDDFKSALPVVKEKYLFLRDRTLNALAKDRSVFIRFSFASTVDEAFSECSCLRKVIPNISGNDCLFVLGNENVPETIVRDDLMVFKLDSYQGDERFRWCGNDASWDKLFSATSAVLLDRIRGGASIA